MPHGAGEPVSGFGPFGAGQLTVVGVEPDVEVGDSPAVILVAGGERVLQERLFEVLCPLDGRPDLLFVVQCVVVEARPVGDDCVVGESFDR